MKFYKIAFQDTGDSKFAWANGYGPIATDINDIPFLKETPEKFKMDRLDSWKFYNSPPGIEFDSGGKEWPDILGCGGGPLIFL